MHTVTKVLIIVNLVVCLILSQYVWISLAGNVQWREKFEFERDARHRDKDRLEQAYNDLLAARAANQERTSQNSAELAALNATKQGLEAWRDDAKTSAEDAERMANELTAAVQPFDEIQSQYNTEVVERLQETVGQLTSRKAGLYSNRGENLEKLANQQTEYAQKAEDYRRVEFQMFLLQEELESRLDLKARYRWLRPDIQADLGDNGPVIFAKINWAVGNSVQLDKGRRDGVELHQKYTITRNGVTIAVVDVVEVQNETCECIVTDLINKNAKPSAGDEAITRLFMSRMKRR